MTKEDAIRAMHEGKKVSHRFFSSSEWMTIQNGKFLFEDDCICEFKQFWLDRTDSYWNDGWSIW